VEVVKDVLAMMKRQIRKPQFLHLVGQFKIVRRYLCHLRRFEHVERAVVFIHYI
jgi:transposase